MELFDGYNFEIAGSLQFPTSRKVSAELGLDKLPAVDLDVMSVSLRGIGDDPVIYYADPMKLLTHLNDVHGAEAVNGMAGLMAWSQAPTRAFDRFLPDREKHGALRGMLAFLAVNTTYRGPATPGRAAALAFGLAVPDEDAVLMKRVMRRDRRSHNTSPGTVHLARRATAVAK